MLDASALTEWAWRSPLGILVGERIRSGSTSLHVPYLADLEVTSALRSAARTVSGAEAAWQALERYRGLRLRRYPHLPLLDRVWELRQNLTLYDAVYAALAELLDAELITCDRRLAQAPGTKARITLLAAPAD
ncbi:MAG: type II toxin-antitoxin system VapC family toxin [Terriglobales bacterium]